MQFELKIDVDNAAFEDNLEGELAQLLERVQRQIHRVTAGETLTLRDSNNNRVGTARLAGDTELRSQVVRRGGR